MIRVHEVPARSGLSVTKKIAGSGYKIALDAVLLIGWDRVKVYRRTCSSFSSFFFIQVELLQLVARVRNIFRVALAGSLSCFLRKLSKLAK